MSFQPSVEVDRSAFNMKITRQEFPVGVAGVRLSLSEIARRIREGGRSPSVRSFAAHIVKAAGISASQTIDATQTAEVFLSYVHANVQYAPDPVMTEFNQIAEVTLCVPGAPMCIPVGDCDDLIVALGSLLMSYGVPVRIVKQTFGAADQEHVLLQFQTEDGSWIYIDPSVKDQPLGWHAPASEEVMIDPLDPAAIGMVAGTPEAEYIGVGRPLGRTRPRDDFDDFDYIGASVRKATAMTHTRKGSVYEEVAVPNRSAWPWRPIAAVATVTTDVFTQSANDLATMNTVIASGDSGLAASTPDYQGAVASYQSAGNTGATTLGPEIVAASSVASGVTGPIVQQALSLNNSLQALNNSSSTSTDATTAQGLVKQMAALYAQAIDAGRATVASGGGLTFTQWAFIAGAVGAVLGAGWAYYQHSKASPAVLPAKKHAVRHKHKRLAAKRYR